MAKYNTFIVFDCKKRVPKLVTSSARKATKELETGKRIDVWCENKYIETIYAKTKIRMKEYVTIEKKYIADKQAKAERRNRRKMRWSDG